MSDVYGVRMKGLSEGHRKGVHDEIGRKDKDLAVFKGRFDSMTEELARARKRKPEEAELGKEIKTLRASLKTQKNGVYGS